jgi:hypothetical protein
MKIVHYRLIKKNDYKVILTQTNVTPILEGLQKLKDREIVSLRLIVHIPRWRLAHFYLALPICTDHFCSWGGKVTS